jgi:hypothetical protein
MVSSTTNIFTQKHKHQKINNFALSSITTAGLGELLHDSEITGNPTADMLIKIILPLISGVISPIVKEWIETRKHLRIQRKNKTKKNVK